MQERRKEPLRSVPSLVKRAWFKSNVFLALNMLDTWERCIVWLLLGGIVVLTFLALHKQYRLLLLAFDL